MAFNDSQDHRNRKRRFRRRIGQRHLERLEARHLLAAEIVVNTFADVIDTDDGLVSLREAILQGNSDGQESQITLPAGTYSLSLSGAGEDLGQTGDLDVLADGTLTIEGAGAEQTIIDAGGNGGIRDRVFQVFGGANLTINALTVMGGYTSSAPGAETAGAGIRVMQTGTLNVNDSVIRNNRAGSSGGGGIENYFGTVRLTGATIAENDAAVWNNVARGGGIHSVGGNLSIRASRIENNQSDVDAGAHVRGPFFIENTIVQGNTARSSGTGGLGLSGGGSSGRVLGSTFVDNEGVGVGGLAVVQGGANEHILVANTTVVGNRGGYGGVSTSCGNVTSTCGDGTITFVNVTIAGNSGTSAGGIWLGYHKKPEIHNTLIAGNFAGDEATPSDVVGALSLASADHSLIGDASTTHGITHDSDGDFASGTNNIVGIDGNGTIDPLTLFVDLSGDGKIDQHDLADNGGITPTLLLRSDSLAVDVGSDAEAANANLTTDQRGAGFPRTDGVRTDIGAFEVEVNDPPRVNGSITDLSATEEFPFSFAIPQDFFIDPEGDDYSLEAHFVSDSGELVDFPTGTICGVFCFEPPWIELKYDDASALYSLVGPISAGSAGEYQIRLTATDVYGAAASFDFPFSVATQLNAGMSITIDEDTSALIDVRTSDIYPETPLVVSAVGTSANATIAIGSDYTIRYEPIANFFGEDTFTFTISEPPGGEIPPQSIGATITVNVLPVNDPPRQIGLADYPDQYTEDDGKVKLFASPLQFDDVDDEQIQLVTFSFVDGYAPTEDRLGIMAGDLPGSLSSDFDVETGTLRLTGPATPADFQLAIDSVYYENINTENPSEVVREITVTIVDANASGGENGPKSLVFFDSFELVSAPDAPIAVDDVAAANVGSAVLIDVLRNDSDPDGETLTLVSVGEAVGGTVEIVDQIVRYTASEDFEGDGSFTYTIQDPTGRQDTGHVVVKLGQLSDLLNQLNAGMNAFVDRFASIETVFPGQTRSINLLVDSLERNAELEALVDYVGRTIFANLGDTNFEAELASRGVVINHSANDAPSADGTLFEATVDLTTALQPLQRIETLDLDAIPDFPQFSVLGSVLLELSPRGQLRFGLNADGFYLGGESEFGVQIVAHPNGTGTLGPFQLNLGGNVQISPGIAFDGVDISGDNVLSVDEFSNATNYQTENLKLVLPGTMAQGQLDFDLVMAFLDYVPVDGDDANNTEHGGDPFRVRGKTTIALVEQDGELKFRAFSPSGGAIPDDVFEIANPDIDQDGEDDYTLDVLKKNFIELGRDKLSEYFGISEFAEAFSQTDTLGGSSTKANDTFDLSAITDFLTQDLLDSANADDPETDGPLKVSKHLNFDDIKTWLGGGLPETPADIVQIQLRRFKAEAKQVDIDLDSLLPPSMQDDGWMIDAEVLKPTISGNLTFGIDTSDSPFYLQTGAETVGSKQVPDSKLVAGMPILVTISNPNLLPGRLSLDEAFGAIRPEVSIDFTGIGGVDNRLRVKESGQLASTVVDVVQETLETLEFRLRGSLELPEFQAPEATEPPSLEIFGSMRGIGSDFELRSRLTPGAKFALGGYTVDALSVAFSKTTDPLTGERSHEVEWFGQLSIPIAMGNDITLSAGGEITDEMTRLEVSASVDSIELGQPDQTYLLLQNPTISGDLTVYKDPLQPTVGGIEIGVDKTVIHPRAHISAGNLNFVGDTVLDEAIKRTQREPAAREVAKFLEIEIAEVLDTYGPLVGDARDLVTFAKNRELNVEVMGSAFEILANAVRYSSKTDREFYEKEKDGYLADAVQESESEAKRIGRLKSSEIVANFLGIEPSEVVARFGILIPEANYVVRNASHIPPIPASQLEEAFQDLEQAIRRASQSDADEYVESLTGPLEPVVTEILRKLNRRALEAAVSAGSFPEEALLTDLTGLELVNFYTEEQIANGKTPGEHDPSDPSQDPQTYLTMVELGKELGLERARKRVLAAVGLVDAQAVEIDSLTPKTILRIYAEAESVMPGHPEDWIHEQRIYDAYREGGVEDGDNTYQKYLLQEHFGFPDRFIDNDTISGKVYLELNAFAAATAHVFDTSLETLERTHEKLEELGTEAGKIYAAKYILTQTSSLDPDLLNDVEITYQYVVKLQQLPRLQGLPDFNVSPLDLQNPRWYALFKEFGEEGAMRKVYQIVIADVVNYLELAVEFDIDPEEMLEVRDAFLSNKIDNDALQNRDFWKRVKEAGTTCAIAEYGGDATGGVCPVEPADPYWARIAIEGFHGRIESTGRLTMSVDEAHLRLDRFLQVDAEGTIDQGQTIPAAALDLNLNAEPDDPIITFHQLSASIPAIEVLPTIGLESLVISGNGIDVGSISLSEESIDFGFATAEDVTLSVSPQTLDFSDPIVFPQLQQVLFETGKLVVLPDDNGDGLVEAPEGVSLLYRNGQFLATLPQFDVDFDPFSATLQNASFFLSGGKGNPEYGRIRIGEAQVSVDATGGTVALTARNLKILSDRDGDGLPQVRYSSISLGSAEGLATSIGLGDFLPLDLTEIRFTPGQTVDDQAPSFEVLAKGHFNIDLLADRVDFDPYLILLEADSDELLSPPPGGDGKITSNNDPDNFFEVTLIYDENGTRLKELPGRLGLGIDNLELGPLVLEGEIYLGQFVNGMMPSEFGGFLQLDTTPPENDLRPEIRPLSEDERLTEEEKPPVEDLPDEVLTDGVFGLNASFESLLLTVEGSYQPANLSDSDPTNDFSRLNLTAGLDVGMEFAVGDLLTLHGFGGIVSMSIKEDRSDDVMDPEISVSLDQVRVGLARFDIDVFTFETVGATFNFTGIPNSPLAIFDEVTVGSDVLGLEGSLSNLAFNRRGMPDWERLGGITISRTDEQGSLLSTVFGYLPITVDEIGITFNEAFYLRNSNHEVIGVADASQFRVLVSGGVQSPGSWPEDLRDFWPFTGKVTGLEVDIGRLLDGQFPITNLTAVELGVKPIELGPILIGGNVTFGILEDANGEHQYAKFNSDYQFEWNGDSKLIVPAEPEEDGAFPMLYGRLMGQFSGFDVSGGIDLIFSALGPVQARLILPAAVPLGYVTLSEVSGGISFGVTDIPSVDEALDLVRNPVFFNPFTADTASIKAALSAALNDGVPTLARPFTIGLSGTITTAIPGLISGTGDFVVNVDLSEAGIGLDDDGLPSVNTGVRWLGSANVTILGIPLGRVGLMFDLSDVFNPKSDIGLALPPEDSLLAFLSTGRLEAGATLDFKGVNLLPLIGIWEFFSNLVDDLGDESEQRLDQLADRLNENPRSRLALALDEAAARELYQGSTDPEYQFTGAKVLDILLGTSGEGGLLPRDFSFLSEAISGDGSSGFDPARLASLAIGLMQELPALAVDPDLFHAAMTQGDPEAIAEFSVDVALESAKLGGKIIGSLVGAAGDALIGAAEYFDPRFEIKGAFKPMLFGFPMGGDLGARLEFSKRGLEVELDVSLLTIIKKFGPMELILLATPLGYMTDELNVAARLDFSQPEDFLKLLFPPDNGEFDPVGLADFMIDNINPLNPKWSAAISGGLTAFGFSVGDIDGIAFGPQFDDGDWIFNREEAEDTIVTERLRVVTESVPPADFPEDLLRFVIVVDPMLAQADKPYTVVSDATEIPEDVVEVRSIDKFETMLRTGGIFAAGGIDLPRVLSDPLNVFQTVHEQGERDVSDELIRSGWLPPELPDLSDDRLDDDPLGALADLFEFTAQIGVYTDRLLDELTAEDNAGDIELFIPSLATLFDLDSYLDRDPDSIPEADDETFFTSLLQTDVTQLEENEAFAKSIRAIAQGLGEDFVHKVSELVAGGVSSAVDRIQLLFNAAFVSGNVPLELLSIDWGEAQIDASLGGMKYRVELPLLAGLEVELETKTRSISLFDSISEFAHSPLVSSIANFSGTVGGSLIGVGDSLLAGLSDIFDVDSLDNILQLYREGADLAQELPESIRDDVDLEALAGVLALFDLSIPVPVGRFNLELGSENFDQWVKEDSGFTDITDVGAQLIENLFGSEHIGLISTAGVDETSGEAANGWVRDLANLSIDVYTPLYEATVDGQESNIEQNGGYRFGLEMSIPGLIEESAVTIEVQMTEALGEIEVADLVVPDFALRAEAARLALPASFLGGTNDLISIGDVVLDLTKSNQGISAHARGLANLLGTEFAMVGDLQMINGGFAGLLLLSRQQPEPLAIAGGQLEGTFLLQFNTTGIDVALSETPVSQELLDLLTAEGITEMTIAPGAGIHAVGELTLPALGVGVKLTGQFDLLSSESDNRKLLEVAASGSIADSANTDGLFNDAINVYGYLRFGGNLLPIALDAARFTLGVNDVSLLNVPKVSINGVGTLEVNNTGSEITSPLLLQPIAAGNYLNLDLSGDVSLGNDLGFGGEFSITLDDGLILVSIETRFGQALEASFEIDRSASSVGLELAIDPADRQSLADLTTMLRGLGISSAVGEMLDSGYPKFNDGAFLDLDLSIGPDVFDFDLVTRLTVSTVLGSLSGSADIQIGKESFSGTLSGDLSIGLLKDSVTAVIQPDRCIKITPGSLIFGGDTFRFPLSADACKPNLVLGDVSPTVEGGQVIVPFEILNLDPDDYGWDEGRLKVFFDTHGGLSASPGTDFAYLRNRQISILPSEFEGDVYRGQFTVPTFDDDDFEITETFRVSVQRIDFGDLKGQRFDPLGIQTRVDELRAIERGLRNERDAIVRLCLTPSSFDAIGCIDALVGYAQDGASQVVEYLAGEISVAVRNVTNATTCMTSLGTHDACDRVPGLQLTSTDDIAIAIALPDNRYRTARIEDDGDEVDKFVPTAPANAIVFYSFQPIQGTNAQDSVEPEIATVPASYFGFNESTGFRFAEGVPDSQDATDAISRGASPPIGFEWDQFPATYELPERISINSAGEPVLTNDKNQGIGYLMYSEQDLFERFAAHPPYNESGKTPNSAHLIAVRFTGIEWQHDDNTQWHPFEPRPSDRLIARLNFTAGTADLLEGLANAVYGIRLGYDVGDLSVQTHIYEGQHNPGELLITGTSFGDIAPAGFQFTVEQDGQSFSPSAIEFWDKPAFFGESWDLFILQAGQVTAILHSEIAIPTIDVAQNATAHPELDGWRKLRVEIPTLFESPGDVSFRLVPTQDPSINYLTGTQRNTLTTLNLFATPNKIRPIIDNVALIQGPEPNLVSGKTLQVTLEDANFSIQINGPGRIEYSPGPLDPAINPVRMQNFLPSIQLHNVDATTTVTVSVTGRQSGAGPLTFASFASSAGFAELNMTAAGAVGGRFSLGGAVADLRFDRVVEGSRISIGGLRTDEVNITTIGSINESDVEFPGEVSFNLGGGVIGGRWALGAIDGLNTTGPFGPNVVVDRDVRNVQIEGDFLSPVFDVHGDVGSVLVSEGHFRANLSAASVDSVSVTATQSTPTNPYVLGGTIDADSIRSVSVVGGNIDGLNLITRSVANDVDFLSALPNGNGSGGLLRSLYSFHLAGGVQTLEADSMMINLVAGGDVGRIDVGSEADAGLLVGNITANRVGYVNVFGDAKLSIETTANATQLAGSDAIDTIQIHNGFWRGGKIATAPGTGIGTFEMMTMESTPYAVVGPLTIASEHVDILRLGDVDAAIEVFANVTIAEIQTTYSTIEFSGQVGSLAIDNDQSENGVVVRAVDQSGNPAANSILTGQVFYDVNGNGIRDLEEPTLPDRFVRLLNENGEILATQAAVHFDVNGNGFVEANEESNSYRFTRVLSGTYRVQVSGQNLLQAVSDEILISEQDNLRVDFAISAPWTNPVQLHDVNGNGAVSPVDALTIINYIARVGNVELIYENQNTISNYVDVSGDGRVSPIDALRVINYIARTQVASQQFEGESAIPNSNDLQVFSTERRAEQWLDREVNLKFEPEHDWFPTSNQGGSSRHAARDWIFDQIGISSQSIPRGEVAQGKPQHELDRSRDCVLFSENVDTLRYFS